MKTAISIPDPVFEAAEEFARRLGMSRSKLYTKAVKKYLEEHKNERVTARLNEIYSREPSGLDNVVQALQYSSLTKDEW
jgi:metal-responsive CopG/Arc/MetJ family transcriptional regulator